MPNPLASFLRIERPSATGQVRVHGRRIYILPTRYGVVFGLLLLLTLIGAVNYGNNPAFLLTFLLAGLGSNAIFQTWRNLEGMRITPLQNEPVFAGQSASFRFLLRSEDPRERPALQLGLADSYPQVCDLAGAGEEVLVLTRSVVTRGWTTSGRLVLSTRYPLGLLCAWCYIDAESRCLVYPRPGKPWEPAGDADYGGSEQGDRGVGADDFIGLRNYRLGDSPGHIDWRALAREQGLITKQFGGDRVEKLWLTWGEVPGADPEARLSRLCRALLDAERGGLRYGLRIGRRVHAPANGSVHLKTCLTTLAEYPEGT
jgi:uncharacterized protein (DUF58 family)